MLNRQTHRLTAWLALVVMLLGAMAPTVSRALAASRGAVPGIEVCTSQGPRWIALAEVSSDASTAAPTNSRVNDSPDGPESHLVLDHCPFCLHIADRLGPPPAASMHFFNAESGLARPDVQALFFETYSVEAPLPRGPPVFS